jgi:hypothetical protein
MMLAPRAAVDVKTCQLVVGKCAWSHLVASSSASRCKQVGSVSPVGKDVALNVSDSQAAAHGAAPRFDRRRPTGYRKWARRTMQ